MNEGTNEPRSIEERQDDIVADFLSIDDPLSQYEYLLEFAAALPALDEAPKTDENLVEGCQSQVWLVLEDRGGRLGLQADSDTLIVRGVLQLLVQVVDGQPLEDVAQATIDFPARADLMATFNDARRKGVGSIIATIKAFAAAHAA